VIDRELLASADVVIRRRTPPPRPGVEVLEDPNLSVGGRLTLMLIEFRQVVGQAGLRDLRKRLGVAAERATSYLDELHRHELIDVVLEPQEVE